MSEKVVVKFKKLHADAVIPKYQKDGDAGFDLHAICEKDIVGGVQGTEFTVVMEKNAFCVLSGRTCIVPTGLSVAVPKGYEIQIRPRSGLAAKNGITVLNTPGTIDSGYRGEVKVILHNTSHEDFVVRHLDRIAQGVISIVPSVEIQEVTELDETERGAGGFGSTGTK